MVSNAIWSILEDETGALLFATPRGITKYIPPFEKGGQGGFLPQRKLLRLSTSQKSSQTKSTRIAMRLKFLRRSSISLSNITA